MTRTSSMDVEPENLRKEIISLLYNYITTVRDNTPEEAYSKLITGLLELGIDVRSGLGYVLETAYDNWVEKASLMLAGVSRFYNSKENEQMKVKATLDKIIKVLAQEEELPTEELMEEPPKDEGSEEEEFIEKMVKKLLKFVNDNPEELERICGLIHDTAIITLEEKMAK